MQRIRTPERSHWREQAEEFGFRFHTMYGEPYWDETVYYQFTLQQIEQDLEAPTEELHQMCLAVVEKVVQSEELLQKFQIPEIYWQWIRDSWLKGDPSLYSRLDLAYSGNGPAKLLENNADTPTSLYETGFWQWLWLEDKLASGHIPASSDQFNSLQDKLIERFETFKTQFPQTMHFSACQDTEEDRATVQYLQDCAEEVGFKSEFVFVEDIGLGENGEFTDLNDHVIDAMFKLYPWEFMLREEFGPALLDASTQWLEPPWKAIVSNKAMLPLLWQMFPGHPNLLPAFFEGDKGVGTLNSYVKKPIFAREGANVDVVVNGHSRYKTDGPYGEEGFIYQEYTPLPKFDDHYALIGAWLVNDQAAGISVRQDVSPITANLSRYVPHTILY